jgi:transposase
MGRSRSGLTTKIHALVDAASRPVWLSLSPGQAHDGAGADGLNEFLRLGATLLADKAYDSAAIRGLAQAADTWANIPPRRNRTGSFAFGRWLYRQRNLVERFFSKLKQFRGIATRHDQRPENFLAAIKLASVRIRLRSYESTT